MNSISRLRLLIMSLLFLTLISAPLLKAQYFGRNKVQYETFDFKVMKTEHFDIYFYPENEQAAQQAARMAERWYARLSRIFKHDLRGRQPLILYASGPHFQQTTAIPGIIGEGTGGVTEMFKRRIILPLGATLAESDHVIGHELVHAFQFDITSYSAPRNANAPPTALRLPLWFIEGLAEYLSIGPNDPHTAMWMRDITQRDKIPAVKKLNNPKYFPYRYGQALWAYITGRWGDSEVASLMKGVGRAGDYEVAIEKLLGLSLEELSTDWQEAMKKAYVPLSKITRISEKSSRPLFVANKENPLNVSPSLSPDGKKIVFLSTRDLFSIDMYLADSGTGQIERKLVRAATNPHFESLQFIKSSGSWDAKGRRFVFGAISKGQPVLTLIDVKSGKTEKEVKFPELGEILNPTWSPDGRFIAFSAVVGGLTDIYIYDLETEELKNITDDSYSDLYPVWSPDGRAIAFVTDRFSTTLSILNIGNYELALMNPDTGEIQRVPAFSKAKNINPQWSPDSRSLYFISDQNGISNIYRIDLESEKIFQITNLYTGVSGITGLSPALSLSQETGQLAYCVYEEDKYSIYALDSLEDMETKEPVAQFGQINPSLLPPREKPQGDVVSLLNNPLYGLPGEAEFEVEDYKPKLTLDYVTQPQLAVGVDRFGTYTAGGIAMIFSDMLGYNNLVTMFQVSSRLADSTALVGFQNTRRRLNWGVVVQRIPYVYGGFRARRGEVFGQPAIIEEEIIFRQVNYQVSGFAAYPFDQSRRFEVSGGYRLIDFDDEVWTRAFSLVTGAELVREKEKLPSAPSLHFGFATAALVYDSALYGATSPILGQSYRLEVSPTFGTLDFYTVLADYRRYFMPFKPFTLAFRILHFGRYGGGGEDDRLYPLFIGYESLVRGYNIRSFSVQEVESATDPFDFDQLLGSRIVVANAEFRFPLLGVLGIGRGYYGFLPIEFNAFFDTGLAWWSDDDRNAWFLGGDRKLVSSVGVGLRMNMFGYLILGAHLVNPLSRPNKDWHFQFTLTPGF
ncbi:MAG: BamA/TamA family outer membrane protein [Candidatus Aminicenantes bacterium]|nr:BamA/TamA family outer membrane protein [Candidatus Aminicenantes bacterium]